VTIDRHRTASRIGRDIDTLSTAPYTRSSTAICRYAYTPEYARALGYVRGQLAELGFAVAEDAIGNLVARNRPIGEPVLGIGSHIDSTRNGGKYDGTLGVVVALEASRLDVELRLGLPLQVTVFLEEEGSGFGQMLLGSRVVTQRVAEVELRSSFRAIDDGRPFWDHASAAGYRPEDWQECALMLNDLVGWIEVHIEQGRVLQDTGNRVGVVAGIAGAIHGDIEIQGRADHAGATPMGMRIDAGLLAAEAMLELEQLATQAGEGVVATAGELELRPGEINVIPGYARLSVDIRGMRETVSGSVAADLVTFVDRRAAQLGASATWRERQTLIPTIMDSRVVNALIAAVTQTGEPWREIVSGAVHDTLCLADHVPSAMLFVPCKDGISHSPREAIHLDDAALATEVLVNAMLAIN
jgi:hydantoinase/carbamoylase family amidase